MRKTEMLIKAEALLDEAAVLIAGSMGTSGATYTAAYKAHAIVHDLLDLADGRLRDDEPEEPALEEEDADQSQQYSDAELRRDNPWPPR